MHSAFFTVRAIFTRAVNKPATVKIEGKLSPAALRALRAVPGIEAGEATIPERGRRTDALITTSDRQLSIAVEVKSRVNAAAARHLADLAASLGDIPLLVVTGHTTAEARTLLQDKGVGFVDGDGNAHLELPGVLVHVTGRTTEKQPLRNSTPRLTGKAGVIAQALLLDTERAWKITDLAARASVSNGLAHRVITRLEDERLITTEGAGPRRVRHLTNPTALLDLWAEEQQDRTRRATAYFLAASASQVAEHLVARLETAGTTYALSGPAGAELVAPFITAVPVIQAWIAADENPQHVCHTTGSEQVPTGHNVVFMQEDQDGPLAFRQRIGEHWVTNAMRLYLDLRNAPKRGREQADHLRETVIGF